MFVYVCIHIYLCNELIEELQATCGSLLVMAPLSSDLRRKCRHTTDKPWSATYILQYQIKHNKMLQSYREQYNIFQNCQRNRVQTEVKFE